MDDLDAIRQRIEAIDEKLMDLVAERVELAESAGAIKRQRGLDPRDFVVERSVVDRFRGGFTARGLEPSSGEQLASTFFSETLRIQETAAQTRPIVEDETALVVGGAGRMGTWLVEYLGGIGFDVVVNDPAGDVAGARSTDGLVESAASADVVLLSVPPEVVGSVLHDLEGIDSTIIDIASLKSPFAETSRRLAASQPVTSVHPMWGPQTRVLSDKYLLVCDCGHAGATARATELFAPTQATLVEVPLAEHDRAMAFTQALPHAVSLLYADVLTDGPFTMEELDERGGRSFAEQVAVTRAVVGKDPQLYHQIQALNEHADDVYRRLQASLDQLERERSNADAFADAMARYHRFFDGQSEVRHP